MRKLRTSDWMGGAFLAALLIIVSVYAFATPAHRLTMALRATARWSFLWFCLATYGGALTVLFGSTFRSLARRGRDFGLAFAAAHLAHVGLVIWFLYGSPNPFPRLQLVVFALGLFWIYLLALFSLSSALSGWLGPRWWKMVRTIGVEYIALAYAFDFGSKILDGNRANALHYFPLFAVAVGGPLLRLSAWVIRRIREETAAGLLQG
jgi:hypothetical protein